MTRKDYQLIASTLKASNPRSAWSFLKLGVNPAWEAWTEVCYNIADALASENPRFDRVKFLSACGVSE